MQERFEEHNLKVSCLYPEVHDGLKKQTFPAPLIVQSYETEIHHYIEILTENPIGIQNGQGQSHIQSAQNLRACGLDNV